MRSSIAAILVVVGVVCAWGAAGAVARTEVPFHRGVNLTSWLQVGSARQIQFTMFTKQDIVNIKSLGCDVIRLPINLHFMTGGAPDYTVDPLFFYFLDQIVDWCEELEIHLILDNHTFDVTANTDPNVDKVLVPVWSQMAEHYQGRSTYLCYEILNEPHGIADARWGQIQQQVIIAIRAVDRVHTIVVTGAGWGSYNNLKFLPIYRDNNLIYSFHFYDPFMFTHQGASWTESVHGAAGRRAVSVRGRPDARVPAGTEGDVGREQPELVQDRRHGQAREGTDRHRGQVPGRAAGPRCSAASLVSTG